LSTLLNVHRAMATLLPQQFLE